MKNRQGGPTEVTETIIRINDAIEEGGEQIRDQLGLYRVDVVRRYRFRAKKWTVALLCVLARNGEEAIKLVIADSESQNGDAIFISASRMDSQVISWDFHAMDKDDLKKRGVDVDAVIKEEKNR
jgi:hypothetical protein